MFRNEHTVDGTHLMPKGQRKDCNITILGGRWEESYRKRLGYGESGMYGEERTYYGVSTAMFFNNIENLHYKDICINSQKIDDIKPYVRVSVFYDINKDGHSTAKGEIKNYIKGD